MEQPYTIPMIRSIRDILEKVSERQQRVQILRIIFVTKEVQNGEISIELNNLSVNTAYTYYLVAENANNDVSEMQTVKFTTLKRTLTKDDFQIVGSTEFTYTHNGDIHVIEVRPVEEKEGSFGINAVQYKEKVWCRGYW